MSRLLIIGAGGHGAVVAEAAVEMGYWQEIRFLDDSTPDISILNFQVVGTIDDLAAHAGDDSDVIIAVGDNRKRLSISCSIVEKDLNLATVIHPTAYISKSAVISSGTVICAGAIVNARAQVGRASIINTAATVDHDCVVGQGAHISPGANLAGGVMVGDCAWIGIGSAVKEGIQIGHDAVIGAGAAVILNVADDEKVGGVPAERL